MKYPIEVKGNIVNNDDELHELLELDIITSEEYVEITSEIDYKGMELDEKQKEFEERVKQSNKRTNWKKECEKLNRIIYELEEKVRQQETYINDLIWKQANK